MADFTQMTFSPADGLNNTTTYDATPNSEAEARAQVQGISDELRDFINDDLIAELECAVTDHSGAERIGSAPISGVTGDTVYAQIDDLKTQMTGITQGAVGDGTITTAKLSADAVTGAKIADDAIDSEHYADGSIDTAHLSADCVTGAKIADDSIDSEHYADGSIDAAHISAGAVTETKLGVGAVTETKIADDAVKRNHIADGEVGETQLDTTCDRVRKITISIDDPSDGSDGDIWLKYS